MQMLLNSTLGKNYTICKIQNYLIMVNKYNFNKEQLCYIFACFESEVVACHRMPPPKQKKIKGLNGDRNLMVSSTIVAERLLLPW